MAMPISPPSASTSRTRWPLPVPPMAGFAGHQRQRVEVERQKQRPVAHAGQRQRRLAAGVPRADDHRVKSLQIASSSVFLALCRAGAARFPSSPRARRGTFGRWPRPRRWQARALPCPASRAGAVQIRGQKAVARADGVDGLSLRRWGVQLRARPEGERQSSAGPSASAPTRQQPRSPRETSTLPPRALDERPRRGGVGRAGQRLQLALVGLQKVGAALPRPARAPRRCCPARWRRPFFSPAAGCPPRAPPPPRPARSRTRPAPRAPGRAEKQLIFQMVEVFFRQRFPGAVVHLLGKVPRARPCVDDARGRGDVHGQYVDALLLRKFGEPRPPSPRRGDRRARPPRPGRPARGRR